MELFEKCMEYKKFVRGLASAKTKEKRIEQGIIGMSTEAGELLDALKKQLYQNRPIDIVNLKEEMGDSFFYFTELMDVINTDLFEIMAMNTAKLKKRYPEGYVVKDRSVNRDIEQERTILESSGKKEKSRICNNCTLSGVSCHCVGAACDKFTEIPY